MTEGERANAVQQIKQLKAQYFRGVDCNDGALVRSVLAEDCVLDYRGCCTDPATGRDFLPAMNAVMKGRSSWGDGGMAAFGIVSVHQGHNFEIEFESETLAHGIWSMTDRLWFSPGGDFALMTGYGHYHETYEKVEGRWYIKTIRITRIRVEAE